MKNYLKTNLINILTLAAVIALFFFSAGDPLVEQGLMGAGVTNFDSLTLSNDLIVGDDATITGDLTVSGTPSFTGVIDVTAAQDFTYVQSADAGATGDSVEIAWTSPVDTTGTNTHNAFTIDLAIGNATGGTNNVRGIQIDNITGDAQVTETAINVGTGWDSGLTVASPATFSSTVTASGAITTSQDVENLGSLPTVLSVQVDIDNDSSPFTCATVTDGEIWFIHAVYANVLDNFATGGSNDATFSIGDSGDTDGLLDLDDAELQVADTEGTGAPAAWQGFMSTDTVGAYLAQGLGFIYAPSGSDATITCTFAGTGLASDTASVAKDITVYIVYTRIQ